MSVVSLGFFFFLMILRPPRSTRTDTLFPYTTLFRSHRHLVADGGHGLEEFGGILDRHVEHVGDRMALELHLERLAIVARALADIALDVAVGEEVHLDLDQAVAGARFAAAALDVRSEERRVGNACVSTCRSRREPLH